MNFLEKIQSLPERERRIILYSIMTILSIVVFYFYIKDIEKRIKGFQFKETREEIQFPNLKEELKKFRIK